MAKPPTIAELRADLFAIELICGVKACRHSSVLPLETFATDDTVITISKRGRCSKCGGKSVDVAPRWRPMKGSGLPL